MTHDRLDRDRLLAHVEAEEAKTQRGKLRIFFGYAAGVGKTFAMLEAAQREKTDGAEVVVGCVEPHGRQEAESLLEGLEKLPTKAVANRGAQLREFDLDTALARKPVLILIDEMAHTNAEGCRHTKRWQDIEELLNAGVNVWTTLNVQHIESLNDVIEHITGVTVGETVPDTVFERANDLVLIDITPEELIGRLQAGKVYIPAQSEQVMRHFFQRANLVVLREMSLRRAAERVQQDVEIARRGRAARETWATSERLLVCIGPSPTTAKIIRTAKRMAAAFDAEWLAVSVEPPGARIPLRNRERIARHLRLAERLGAEPITLVGDPVGAAIVQCARTRNVTKIVVGKTAQPWWRRLLRNTVVDQLLESSGDIDVYVIRGERDRDQEQSLAAPRTGRPAWDAYLRTALVVFGCGLIGWGIFSLHMAEANIVMVFLLAVAFVAARYGRGPAIAASIASVLAFDFFFVPPYLTLAVAESQYILTFGVMLVIGLVISTLSVRLREQVAAASDRLRRTAALHRLSRQLAALAGADFILAHASRQLGDLFDAEVVIYLRESQGRLVLRQGERMSIASHPQNLAVAQWVIEHEALAGAGTDTLPNVPALFVPLTASQSIVGVLAIRSNDPARLHSPTQRRLLEACAGQIALAIERDQLALEAHQARLQVEAEKLRSTVLSSVSHDLRTPLTAISGASSMLMESGDECDRATRRELVESIYDEAERLNRLIGNLLDMTRLEAGAVTIQKEWQPLEEIVGVVLNRLGRWLQPRRVAVSLPADLPLVPMDGQLVQQVLTNLLENAAKHTPADTPIELSASANSDAVTVVVADRGAGITPGDEERIFDKFYRPSQSKNVRGVGLGLTICRAVVAAHGGRIWTENREDGGAIFRFTLPLGGKPPGLKTREPELTADSKPA
jgi:two-component system, OmpR family, sensor histidine kinase KdpD